MAETPFSTDIQTNHIHTYPKVQDIADINIHLVTATRIPLNQKYDVVYNNKMYVYCSMT